MDASFHCLRWFIGDNDKTTQSTRIFTMDDWSALHVNLWYLKLYVCYSSSINFDYKKLLNGSALRYFILQLVFVFGQTAFDVIIFRRQASLKCIILKSIEHYLVFWVSDLHKSDQPSCYDPNGWLKHRSVALFASPFSFQSMSCIFRFRIITWS